MTTFSGLQCVCMSEFAEWLEGEIQKRGWRAADLAREARIGRPTLSHILSGIRNAGPDVALAIARALDLPPEQVFRKAGILPELPGPENDPTFRQLLDIARNMTPDERQELLDYALYRYRRANQEE